MCIVSLLLHLSPDVRSWISLGMAFYSVGSVIEKALSL